jgi:acetolactate synthase I/II/III large subunit
VRRRRHVVRPADGGTIRSGAEKSLGNFAEETGALMAVTLLAKVLFDGNAFALDIAGTFSSDLARQHRPRTVIS